MKAPGQPLKVAVCQMTSIDDVEKNLEQILELLGQVPDGVDLVCFPENSLYLRLHRASETPKMTVSEPCLARLQGVVDQRKFDLFLGSAPMANRLGRPGNATVYFTPGITPKVVYKKVHLFDVDVKGAPPVRESDHFAHGDEPHVMEIKSWRIGLSICYDLRFSELYSKYAREGVHLILIPSAFLVPTGAAHWHILVRARAIESQAYVIAAAQAGEHVGVHGERRSTYGHSLAVDPWGDVLADLGETGPKVEVVTLEPACLERVWRQIPQAQHRRLR